jgi:membrane protein
MATAPAAAGDRLHVVARLGRAAVRRTFHAIDIAFRVVDGEGLRLRAMALTYMSLFALVPALVVAFSVVQAFTGVDAMVNKVHEFVFANLAVGARDSVEPYLAQFVAKQHATSAGLVGGLLLVWSAVSLFSNVERAINDIWGIKRRRSYTQRAVIYWVGLTLGPLLLAGSVTASTAAREWATGAGLTVVTVFAGVLLTCTFFTLVYVIVPATKVQVRAAIAGGLVAGVAWEIAKWGYALVVAKFFRYHAVYGSVAAVPTFLVWLFLSWTILLFGARLAFVIQYAPTLLSKVPLGQTRAGREVLAGQAMLQIALAFDEAVAAPDAGQIASRCRAMAEDVGQALGALRTGGLVVTLTEGGILPARPLEQMTLLDVRKAVAGGGPLFPESGVGRGPVPDIFRAVEDNAADRLAEVTFRALCDRVRQTGENPLPLAEQAGEAVRESPPVGTMTSV